MLQKGNSKRLQNIYSTMKDTTSELQLRADVYKLKMRRDDDNPFL